MFDESCFESVDSLRLETIIDIIQGRRVEDFIFEAVQRLDMMDV